MEGSKGAPPAADAEQQIRALHDYHRQRLAQTWRRFRGGDDRASNSGSQMSQLAHDYRDQDDATNPR